MQSMNRCSYASTDCGLYLLSSGDLLEPVEWSALGPGVFKFLDSFHESGEVDAEVYPLGSLPLSNVTGPLQPSEEHNTQQHIRNRIVSCLLANHDTS